MFCHCSVLETKRLDFFVAAPVALVERFVFFCWGCYTSRLHYRLSSLCFLLHLFDEQKNNINTCCLLLLLLLFVLSKLALSMHPFSIVLFSSPLYYHLSSVMLLVVMLSYVPTVSSSLSKVQSCEVPSTILTSWRIQNAEYRIQQDTASDWFSKNKTKLLNKTQTQKQHYQQRALQLFFIKWHSLPTRINREVAQ